MLKVKVCGMTDPANVKAVAQTGPDFMGFIFYPGSPRYVGKEPDPAIFNNVAADILKVGVFVHEDPVYVIEIAAMTGLDYVQLHGTETPDYCESLKLSGLKIIKDFGICDYTDFDMFESHMGVCDFYLFDTRSEKHGGSGKKFNWDILNSYNLDKPFFLSGGIGPSDAKEIMKIKNPWFMGVDLNSLFETTPGIKIPELVSGFVEEIKKSGNEL